MLSQNYLVETICVSTKEDPLSENMTNENKVPIDEATPDEIYAGVEKWFNIIHSLHLPSEVLNDSNKMEAILRERGCGNDEKHLSVDCCKS